MGGGAGADESVSAAESIIIGGIAGSVAEICVQPALVVRTRMMVQGVDTTGGRSATPHSLIV